MDWTISREYTSETIESIGIEKYYTEEVSRVHVVRNPDCMETCGTV